MIFEDQYKYLQLLEDCYLGRIELWQKGPQLAFGKSFPQNYPHQKLHERSLWSHPSIVRMLAAELDDSKKIKIYFEFFEETLESKIVKQEEAFSEQEITSYYQQLREGIEFIRHNGESIGNLVSRGVFVDSNGRIKVVEDLSYEMRIQNENLAFQLGLILLELGTLDSSGVVYDGKGQVVWKNVEKLVSKMEREYSEQLMGVVRRLLRGEMGEKRQATRISMDSLSSSISSSFCYSNRQAALAIQKSREMLMRL